MRIDPAEFNPVTGAILNAAIEVHRTLGAGLLESAYGPCLEYEFRARNLRFERQRTIPIVYKTIDLGVSYRIDLIVADLVVVEVKSLASVLPVHEAQVITYMRLSRCPIGLLINFNAPRLMDGVKRMINPSFDARRPPDGGVSEG